MYKHADALPGVTQDQTNQFDKTGVIHDLTSKGWNDTISAVYVPPGRSVKFYEHANGKGVQQDFNPGLHALTNLSINNNASSMQTWRFGEPGAATSMPDADFRRQYGKGNDSGVNTND